MTEQTAAERAQQAYYDRLLRERARAIEAEARRIANRLREEMHKSMKALLGG